MFNLEVIIKVREINDISNIAMALINMGVECKDEKGCLRWEAHHDVEKNIFILIESWESKDDWEHHLTLEPFKKYYEEFILPRVTREIYFTKRLV
jgi:quinol monooxygenase YgiN